MEGGGVILRKGADGQLTEEILASEKDLIQLSELEMILENEFPRVLSVDSFGRKTDRAVDLKRMDGELQADI